MGSGNPHRPRKTGRGTRKAWQEVGLEGEPVLSEVFVQPDKVESKVVELKSRRPVKAEGIHFGPSLPMYRTGPTPETAKRKPSHEISAEERTTALEDEIAGDFREDERRYVRQWVDIYPAEFQKAIENREKNGRKVMEKEIPAIRLSFINQIARWGSGRGMAAEKANLLEKYLDLKLPSGIPEKKPEIVQSNNIKETKEKEFTSEQSSEIRALTKEAIKIRSQVDPSELQEIIEEIIREDLISKGIFSDDDLPRVLGHVTKWI